MGVTDQPANNEGCREKELENQQITREVSLKKTSC